MSLFSLFLSRFSQARKVSTSRKMPRSRNLELETLEDRCVPSCSTISGYVYQDANNNGLYDPGEIPIANSTLELRNAANVVVGTAISNAVGYYEFTYDSTIAQTPTTLIKTVTFPNTQTNFNLNGLVDQFDPALGDLQSIEIQHQGTITSDIKAENTSNVSTSTISGTVGGSLTLDGPGIHQVLNLNQNAGTFSAGMYDNTLDFAGTSGIDFGGKNATGTGTVTLTGSSMQAFVGTGKVTLTESSIVNSTATGGGNLVLSVVSSGAGTVTVIYHYIPSNCLKPGQYTIIQTTQPPGLLDGQESRNGVVLNNPPGVSIIPLTLATGDLPNNNFGELAPATLSGYVYVDANNNGIKDSGETAISGVSLALTGTDDTGSVSRTAVTDANGFYQFQSLRPGTYAVSESQPASYLDGKDTAGSQGGTVSNDQLSSISLPVGNQSINNNFGELSPGGLSGYVYVDKNQNGTKDAGEDPITGVAITLTGTDDLGAVSRNTTTDASGFYQFLNLRPGTYAITEAQPANYKDGQESLGSLGGTLGSDQFTAIALAMGGLGINYNFGELIKENADLSITKTVNQSSVLVGTTFTYTLTITNLGSYTASQVVVKDNLPTTVTFISAFGPGWTITRSGYLLTATTASLPVGVSSVITVTVKAPLFVDILTNTATVTSITPDNNPANNQASVTTLVTNQPGLTFPPAITPLATFGPTVALGKAQFFASNNTGTVTSSRALATYIDGLYRTLLGKPVDARTLNTLMVRLQKGIWTQEQLVRALWNSDAHRVIQARNVYKVFYHRLPTTLELRAALAAFRAGQTEQDLAAKLLTSSEYLRKHPTGASMVAGVNQEVTGAIPDLATLTASVETMGNTSWSVYVDSVLNSTEALTQVVNLGYAQVLRRQATTDEIQTWVAQLQSNLVTPAQFNQSLLTSTEFYQLAYASSR